MIKRFVSYIMLNHCCFNPSIFLDDSAKLSLIINTSVPNSVLAIKKFFYGIKQFRVQ